MHKGIGLLGLTMLLIGCSGAVKCRLTHLEGERAVHSKYQHGEAACMALLETLPLIQAARPDTQIIFGAHANKKKLKDFRDKVEQRIAPPPPTGDKDKVWMPKPQFQTTAMEVRDRG